MTGERWCRCEDPLTDDDVGAGDGDDFCWRCLRPIPEPDGEPGGEAIR